MTVTAPCTNRRAVLGSAREAPLIGMQGYFKGSSFNLQLRIYTSLVKIFINQNLLLPSPREKKDEQTLCGITSNCCNLKDLDLMLAKTCSNSGSLILKLWCGCSRHSDRQVENHLRKTLALTYMGNVSLLGFTGVVTSRSAWGFNLQQHIKML